MEDQKQQSLVTTQIELVVDQTPKVMNVTTSEDHHHQENAKIMMIIKIPILLTLSPILTKFHAGYFRISLSLCAQALLWKILMQPKADAHALRSVFRLVPSTAFSFLWSLALFGLALQSLLYALRCLFHFDMVKAEFLHHVGVNYLFAPWISWLLLLQSSPFISPRSLSYQASTSLIYVPRGHMISMLLQ